MRRVRFTIRAMGTRAALVAIAIAIWKADLSEYGTWVAVGMRGTLVAAVVLGIALTSLLVDRRNRPYLVGLISAGSFAGLAYWAACWFSPWQVLAYLQTPVDQAVIIGLYFDRIPGLEQALRQGSPNARIFFDVTCFPLIAAIDSLPVLIVAAIGGQASKSLAARDQGPRPVTN